MLRTCGSNTLHLARGVHWPKTGAKTQRVCSCLWPVNTSCKMQRVPEANTHSNTQCVRPFNTRRIYCPKTLLKTPAHFDRDIVSTLEKEDLVRGFKYGSSYVPCPSGQFERLATSKGLDICAFFEQKNVRTST